MNVYFNESVPKTQYPVLLEALEFYADILVGKRMRKNLNISLNFEPDLDCLGEIINEDGTVRSRNFEININPTIHPDVDPIFILAHEMVHLKQHVRNQLGRCDLKLVKGRLKLLRIWEGKVWEPGEGEDEYFDSPWEKEAYDREEDLYQDWLQHYENMFKPI